MRSDDSSAMPRVGKRSATSSAMRSTPGPQATRLSGLAALRALLRDRQREAAVVAVEPLAEAVLDQPGRALRAFDAMAARAAQRQRRVAAPIEEQQRLLRPCASVSVIASTSAGDSQLPLSGGSLAQIDGCDLGHLDAGEAARQDDVAIAARCAR